MNYNRVYKWGWYFMSMELFGIIVFMLSIHIPIYLGSDWEFVGLSKLWKLNGVLPLFALVIIAVAEGFKKYINHDLKGTHQRSVQIVEVKSKNGEALSFLASYFVPLVSFNLSDARHEIVLLLLFVAIGIMYVRGNMFHMNPTLLLIGFKLFEVKVRMNKGDEISTVVITKQEISNNDRISYRKITEQIWYCKKI